MVSVGLFLSAFSITLLTNNKSLSDKNSIFSNELAYKEDAISSLSTIKDQQLTEINQLNQQVTVSADYFNAKLDEITTLENKLQQLIGMFNAQTNVALDAPTSRSGDFTEIAQPDVNVLSDLTTMNTTDDLSEAINQAVDAYSELANQIESTMNFLDAKPTLYPTQGTITSKFGNRRDPITRRISFHKGIDIANARGTTIKAAGAGVVTFAGWSGSYGRVIVISHGYGYKTVYAHTNKMFVEVGDRVDRGEKIAEMGNSGKSTGPHLHFEVHYEGVQINPLKVLE